MNSGYETPDACQSLGYIEIGVKPGMVLISFSREALAAFLVEVDRAMPLGTQQLEGPDGERCTSAVSARRGSPG